MAIIYISRNKINNKCYIGFSKFSLETRIKAHMHSLSKSSKQIIHKAMAKYGPEHFEWSILYESDDPYYTLSVMEPYFIKQYDTFNNGYNSTLGGDGSLGRVFTQESIEKIRQAQLGKKQSKSTIEKRVAKIKGLNRSDETRNKMASTWQITDPNNITHTVKNLAEYCRLNGLTSVCMTQVANGTRKRHKGYSCRRLERGPQAR